MKKLGRYEIIEELGRGAMGRVYRARDPQIDRVVALKTFTLTEIDESIDNDFRERFFREAKAAGKLLHPGIVTIFDVGEDPDTKTPFIVMELIEGRSLEEIGRENRPSREECLDLVRQLAEALDYAHSMGIVHRDIKPSNIIVTPRGQAKIADFGVAKLQTTQLTQTGVVMGTPVYMSPEQMVGDPVDGRSDLFSLASILYWLLTGERPFTGTTMATLSFQIVYSEPISPSRVNPTLTDDDDYVTHRGLAKEREKRYPNGHEFAHDLDDLKHGRSPRSRKAPAPLPSTPPPPPVEKRAADKNPNALALAAAAVLVVALVGVGWWAWKPEASTPENPPSAAAEAPQPPGQPAGAVMQPVAPPVTEAAPRPVRKRPAARQAEPAAAGQQAGAQTEPAAPAATQATLRVEGEHGFEYATLNLYADGQLLKQLTLESPEGTKTFGTEVTVPPGNRVISVTVRERGKTETQRDYVDLDFKEGQTKTLLVSFDRNGQRAAAGKMTLHRLD